MTGNKNANKSLAIHNTIVFLHI